MQNKEFRFSTEIRNKLEDGNSRIVDGYAAVFDSPSQDLGGFTEIIDKRAFDGVIVKSDVFALLDHSDAKGILARSKYGEGSLELTVDERGLHYRFEAPDTPLGNELLSYLRRKEITQSSFAFTVAEDSWEKQADNTYIRTINKIDELFDVSPVFKPAYSETSVALRKLQQIKDNELEEMAELRELEELKKELKELREKLEDKEKEECSDEEEPKKEECSEPEEEPKEEAPAEEEPKEEPKEEAQAEEEPKEEEPQEEEPKKEENNKRNNTNTKMNTEFKLLRAINKIANNQPLDEVEQEVLNAGKSEFRKSNLSTNGQITLPMEYRDYSVGTTANLSGAVGQDMQTILDPLRAQLVTVKAGAKYMDGLVGDVNFPILGKQNVAWAAETSAATDGSSGITNVILKPHRLTAYIDLSKQFLIQDSVAAEEAIRRDLVAAIADKLEATILGSTTGATQPDGLFVASAITSGYSAITTFDKLCDFEAEVEDENVNGACAYIMSNKAKAKVRAMSYSGKTTAMVYQNGELDGTPVYNTSNVAGKNIAYGDWSNLVVANWGGH